MRGINWRYITIALVGALGVCFTPSAAFAADGELSVEIRQKMPTGEQIPCEIIIDKLPADGTAIQLELMMDQSISISESDIKILGGSEDASKKVILTSVNNQKKITFYIANNRSETFSEKMTIGQILIPKAEKEKLSSASVVSPVKVLDTRLKEKNYTVAFSMIDEDTTGGGGSGGGSGGGGSGGGSGGGGGGGSSNTVTKPTDTKEEEKTPETTPPVNNTITFSDVKGHWGQTAIENMVARGALKGYEDGTFRPDNNIRRSEFAMVINNVYSFPKASGSSLSDVEKGQWYTEAIESLAQSKIILGRTDGTFGINDNIKNEDIAVILVRVFDAKKIQLEKQRDYVPFVDDEMISSYAKDAVVKLYEAGLINGVGGNQYTPLANSTRAQVATLLERVLVITDKAE